MKVELRKNAKNLPNASRNDADHVDDYDEIY